MRYSRWLPPFLWHESWMMSAIFDFWLPLTWSDILLSAVELPVIDSRSFLETCVLAVFHQQQRLTYILFILETIERKIPSLSSSDISFCISGLVKSALSRAIAQITAVMFCTVTVIPALSLLTEAPDVKQETQQMPVCRQTASCHVLMDALEY